MSVATLNDLSHLTDVTVPEGIDLTSAELEAAKWITHIADSSAGRFQAVAQAAVDIEKNPKNGRDRKVISFRFVDGESGEITNSSYAGEYRTTSFMGQHAQLKDAVIKSPEDDSLKMDLDVLATIPSDRFQQANEEAKQYGLSTPFVERIQVPTQPTGKGRT